MPSPTAANLPTLARSAPGERSLDVAEELALDQVGGDGAAGHGEKAMLFPRRMLVKQAGQKGLAGAGFAVEQHGDVVVGGQGDALDERQQRRRLGQQFAREQIFEWFGAGRGELAGRGPDGPAPFARASPHHRASAIRRAT